MIHQNDVKINLLCEARAQPIKNEAMAPKRKGQRYEIKTFGLKRQKLM